MKPTIIRPLWVTILFALLGTVHCADSTPTVTISSLEATIVGLGGDIGQFPGVPFAKPPVKDLRFKPPVPLTEPYGLYNATENKDICPQFIGSTEDGNSLVPDFLSKLINSPLFQKPVLSTSENYLYLNIHHPKSIQQEDKLPILFYIYNKGFQLR